MIIKKSAPFALLALIMSFYSRIDPVLIERILGGSFGSEQVGIFAQGYRLLDAGQNFALLFSVLLLPLFAKMIKENQSLVKLLKLSFSIIISGTLIVAVTSLFYGEQIMQLMYTPMEGELQATYVERITESAKIFKLLMFSLVFVSSIYIFGTLLTANNSLKQLNIIAIVSLSANIFLNIIFIPKYFAVGSAYANLAAQGISALLQIIIAYKIFRLSINYSLILRLVATVLLLLIAGYLLQYINLESWLLSMGMMLVLGLMISFVLKLLNIGEFIAILKE
jgi:O-antigen/teichoic acid export membrane protein